MTDADPADPIRLPGDDIVSVNSPGLAPSSAEAAPSYAGFWIALAVGIGCYVAMLFSDKLWLYAGMGLEVMLFLPLALLANLGRRNDTFRLLTGMYWLLLVGILLLLSVGVTFAVVADLHALSQVKSADQISLAFEPGGVNKLIQVVGLSALAIFAGMLCFAGPVRRWAAGWLPLDPTSFPDATGLATLIALTLGCLIPAAVLHGPPQLLAFAKQPQGVANDPMSKIDLATFSFRLVWTLPVVLIAAGYPFYRGFREAVRRLGVVWPTWKQWLAVPFLTIGLFAIVAASGWLIKGFWTRMGWPVTDEKQFEKMLEFAFNPVGAAVIGVVAGVTEEIVIRGLFQPRLGIWLPNLMFASVHAVQYNFDGVLVVFIIGLALGYVRRYSTTTTAMAIHGLYDFVAVMLTLYERAHP